MSFGILVVGGAISLVVLGLILFLTVSFIQFKRQQASSLPQLVAQSVQTELSRPLLDLTERFTKNTGDLRQAITDRLSQQFLETQERIERSLAHGRQELQTGLQSTTKSLETKFQSLESQVGLRLETIGKNVETKLNENLREGFKHFEKVQEHLKAAELKLASLNTVGQSISDLNNLLKLPHLRGGFGEATLERLLADFLPPGSFELQYAVVAGSAERVDAVVKLTKQVLPIDSKFPREQVLPLFETQDPQILEDARKKLAEVIRGQAKSIADKYIRPDQGTTDMALLFLPSETLYFEITRNGKLFEDLSKLKVFPVSPNTLAIGLRSVALAQEYYEMARGVEKTIEDIGKARRHFDHFEKKFDEIGKGLKKAQEAFDTANTHLNRYESSVNKLIRDSGAESPEALPSPTLADSTLRAPSFDQGSLLD